MQQGKKTSVDRALFRQVMGSFATGVTVISTQARGEVRGMTANAFMSGSLEPPLCVVSVGKRARIHPHLVESGRFGVSILAKDQEKLSQHFSGGPVADLAPQFVWIGRTPVLAEAAATIGAEVAAQYDCGDHTLFIGHILHLQAHARAPLVVHEGHYASLVYSKERAPEWVGDFW